MKELHDIITALYRPLDYVSKNSFANLDVVKGLEVPLMNLVGQALSLSLDNDDSALFKRLSRNFTGFDSLDTSSKKSRITDSLKLLEQMKDHE
ncbi:MAG: hypothetical protein SVY10_16060, partial [Thermodesulfobacteriota bacterium]|nr:hypothetical protein [Thermodesulfobacteriota bacterium]